MNSYRPTAAERALDVACTKEKNNILAVRQGMPAIGSVLKNRHGIEWLVDGHATAPSLNAQIGIDQDELYPAIVPQNLSKRLDEFASEVDRCTPKVLVPLDTMPHLFPKRGHPDGHWVDAWSDPNIIFLFMDAAGIHETVLAHELAHVWIDLVLGLEDHRALKDKSNTSRYAHVQFIQSFVMDIPVNKVLAEKGFDIEFINNDAATALRNLSEAAALGYVPPTKREGAFLGSFLASSILSVENSEPGFVRFQDSLLAARRSLPDVYALGERLAAVIRAHPPTSNENIGLAVNAALRESFAFCDEDLDIENEILEIPPQVDWEEDKHPEWLRGQSVRGKCEIGIAMARLGADSMAVPEVSYAPNGKVQVRFEHDDGGFTGYAELEHVMLVPGVVHPRVRFAIEQGDRSRIKMEEIFNQAVSGLVKAPKIRGSSPKFPGQRSYSTGLAQWISQVRLAELLSGEKPFTYAMCNPVNYVDPDGLLPVIQKPGTGKGQCPGADALSDITNLLHTHPSCLKDFLKLCNGQSLSAVLAQIKFIVKSDCDPKHPGTVKCATDTSWPGGAMAPGQPCDPDDICFNTKTCSQSLTDRASGLLFEIGNWCNCKYHMLTGGEGPAEKMCRDCGFQKEQCLGATFPGKGP